MLVVFILFLWRLDSMKSANLKLKLTIKGLGFTQLEVAEQMGISTSYFTQLLKKPLEPRYKALATDAIQTLVDNRREAQNAFLEWLNDPRTGLDDETETRATYGKMRNSKPLTSKGSEN